MSKNRKNISQKDMIGLIPAAGFAKRISPLPCSKEIYPVCFDKSQLDQEANSKVVSSYLLEHMQEAGTERIYMVIREGKWDIPSYFNRQKLLDVNLAYLVTGMTESTPHTADFAYPFVKDKIVLFGFPDILIKPRSVFQKLVQKLHKEKSDMVLGLFKADNHGKVDMVKLDDNNKVRQIIIKPQKTELTYTWMVTVWTPVFTTFMHNVLKGDLNAAPRGRELYMGDIIQAGIESGLNVESVLFTEGNYLDIGTPEGLKQVSNLSSPLI